jgi:hypothetical protein
MVSFGSVEEYIEWKKFNFDIIYFGSLELIYKLGEALN